MLSMRSWPCSMRCGRAAIAACLEIRPGYLVKSIREDYAPAGRAFWRKACQSSSETAVAVKDVAGEGAQRKAAAIRVSESDRRIDQYLAGLPAEERSKLENAAVAKARGLPANGLRRSIAAGNEAVAAHYRQVIVRQHVRTAAGPAGGGLAGLAWPVFAGLQKPSMAAYAAMAIVAAVFFAWRFFVTLPEPFLWLSLR